jgi:hypothetical protein
MAYPNVNPSPPADFEVDSIQPGCPMLIRSAAPHPVRTGEILMRCAIGWSIHDDVECARCAAVSAVQDCWKVHPERTPVVAWPADERHPAVSSAHHAAD